MSERPRAHHAWAVLLFAGLALSGLHSEARSQTVGDTLVVGIMADQRTPDGLDMLALLTQEVESLLGGRVSVSFPPDLLLINDFDPDLAEAQYRQLGASAAVVILAVGPVTNSVLSGRAEYPKPTVLFGAINRDLVALPDRPTSGTRNLTYVLTSNSYGADLEAFRGLVEFRRLGVLVPEPLAEILSFGDAFDRYAAEMGFEYELIPYRDPLSIDRYLDSVDAVYLAEGWGLSEDNTARLAERLRDLRIPSFSGVRREDVEAGFLASTQRRQNVMRFLRRVALHIEAIADGNDLGDRPILLDFSDALTINFNTADLLQVPLRYSPTTEFVGEVVNVLAERTFELPDLIDEALQANLRLASARRNVDLAEQNVRGAWANYLPNLSAVGTGTVVDPDLAAASAGSAPQYSTLGTVSLSQVLFSPDANAGISIQNRLREAEANNVRSQELDLALEAADLYFAALQRRTNVVLQKQNLDVTRENLEIARRNLEAGQSGRGDVLRFESASARDMQALVQAVTDLDATYYAINQLVNAPIHREIEVADASLESGLYQGYDERFRELGRYPNSNTALEEFMVEEAVRNAPELRSLESNIAAVERRIVLNGAQRFIPTVSAVARYNRTFDQSGVGTPSPSLGLPDGSYDISFQMSIPLFESNIRRIDRQFDRIQREQLRLDRTFFETDLERRVRTVVLDLKRQITNVDLSRAAEASAAEVLTLTQVAYGNGAASVVELLDAQSNLLRSQLERTTAEYGFLSTTLALSRLIGHFFPLHTDAENEAFWQRFDDYRTIGTR